MTARQKQRAKVAYTGLFLSAVKAAKDAHMLVLDEIVDAVAAGLIDRAVFANNINILKNNIEIVMTGHNPVQQFIDFADYVTDMSKIKHPYDENLPARRGIEF
ncbi:MAG: cob(I)yrinic acid a,c-diamide adenosyltransferase [Oscillospiraceae bacterium]|nr:cob(I)yrinic acid a,c-diamide adenosyltransferase [Oscillospiraceae bacterium]